MSITDRLDYKKIAKEVKEKGISYIPDQIDFIKLKLQNRGYDVAGAYIEKDENYMQYPYLEITQA